MALRDRPILFCIIRLQGMYPAPPPFVPEYDHKNNHTKGLKVAFLDQMRLKQSQLKAEAFNETWSNKERGIFVNYCFKEKLGIKGRSVFANHCFKENLSNKESSILFLQLLFQRKMKY